MKKSCKTLLIVLSTVVVVVAACVIYLISTSQTIMAGTCLVSTSVTYLIVNKNDIPIVMENERDDLFSGLQSGDKILIVSGVVLTSYPGETVVAKCWRIGKEVLGDVPQATLAELQDMGWQFE